MNQSLLILADFSPKLKKNIQTIGLQEIDLQKLFNASRNGESTTYLYVHPEAQIVLKNILNKVKIIKAAGGLVRNGKGAYLFIHRLGHWDLPKGKLENGEKIKEAAVREVEEECGIIVDYVGKKVATTYHTYYMRGQFILKQTNWYDMATNGQPKLVPQKEEDIDQAEWLTRKQLTKVRADTYPLILDLVTDLIDKQH